MIDIWLLGQVTQNNKCIFWSDLISNCAECSIDSGTPKCSKWKVGFKTNSLNGCSRSSWTNSIISSDGLTWVNQCSTSQYLDSTQNKCIDWTISNWKNCFMNKGTEVCYEWGKDPANSNKYLAINFSSCISSCTSPQITDSKGRWVSPPSNTATFIIVKEQDWIILDQLKKGIDVACPHILSANSWNSGYSLIKKSDGTQYWDVCSANTFYDSSSKTWKSCGDNCSECQSLTECKTCTPGTYPVSGKCYWNWPRGKYVSSGTWIKWDDAWGGLNGSCFNAGPNSCDGWQFDTSTNTFVTFLSSNTWVSASNCPPATFAANNGKWMPWVSGWTKWSGPGKENCQDTSITSVDSTLCTLGHCSQCSDLFHCGQWESSYQLTSEGTCAKIWDQGYYSDDNTNWKQCDDTCLTCTKAGECTKCKQKITGENYFVVSLINGQCQYQQCPVNWRLCQYNSGGSSPTWSWWQSGFKLNTLNQCNADSSIISSNSWIPGQRLVDNCWVPWRNPFTERWYSDSGNAEISIACQKGYFLSDGIWVPICKPGYFADQILGWCVKCGWNWNTCTNYMNSCNNDCPTGTFSSTNDRCEHSLSSTPTITVVSSNNEIDVQFPANTSILNMIDTDLANDSIYSVNNVWGDDTFNYDWSDFLTSNINIENMISDLKSKLNENEQNELDYLIAQDYSSVSQSLISNNLLNKYYMQYEGQFEIIKLLALYRWSLYGKTTLANPFTYSNNNFYTDSSIVDDPCGLLFDLNSIFALNDPDWSFTTNSDGTLLISIITEDISKVDPNSSINFNDVIYYVKDTVKLPSPNISINVPASDVHKGMTIVISMKDTITTWEDLSIDYQNSQGLGYNTQVSIILDSIKDTSTGSLVSSNIAAIQATINALLNQLIQRSIEAKSRVIIISRSYLKDFSGKTVYFSIKFQNMVTGEVQSIPKMVSIVGSTMLQIQNQALQINRLISTPINTVRYVSWDSTSSGSSDSQLVCKGYIYVKDSTTGIFSTTQTTFDKCIIDPTKVNVGNIARIWIEATLNGSLKTLDIPFIVDKIQWSWDLSQIKASFGTSESLSFNSIKWPALYALKWTFKDQSGSTSDITFNTNTASFKITDHLTVGKTYMMNIDITNTDMNVVYGSCSHLIDVQNQLTTLNTQIRSVNAGSLQGPLELDIITYDSTNNQIYVDSVTLTLTISGSTTDLLKSTFISSYKLVDNSKLTFNPGIWKTGTTYILTAVSSLKGVTGKATKLISSVDKTLFSADFSPKIASTGDIIKITITNKSSTQCIFWAVGFFNNNMFTPYEIFSEPEQLCGNDEYRTTSIIVPTMSSVDAKNTDLAVLCIGDDTDLSIQERTSLQRYKIMINSKILKAADIVPDSEPITSEDFDRICLSILSLPDTEWPNSYFNSIWNQAISNKQDLIDQYSDQLQKLWKDLTNKLIYSMTKIVTWGDSPLNDSLHDIVRIILNGFCQTFAADDSIWRSGNPNLDDLTWFSFSADFTNLILKVVNNIEAKMLASDNYSDLLDILDIVQSLIEWASTDMISSGSGTEVHSADSSIAILKVKKLDSTFKAEVKYSSSVRRNRRFLATSNTCGVGFDKIASSLSGKENLILKVQLNKKCTQYTSKACDGSVDLTETPSWCEIVIQTSLKDFSGRTSVQVIDVTSDQNGLASLSIPLNTCTTTTKWAYYDKTKSCWATDGVSSSGSWADCKSTHFSIFSYINPSSKSTSSSSNNNPASVITSAVKDNMMMAYQNILLYIWVLLDLYLFILFIKTWRNKNRKIHVASKRVEQINVKGYTRTMPVPRNEDVEEKINNIRSMFEINTANANQNANQNAIQNAHQNDNATAMNAFRIEEAKSIVPPNIERDDNEAEQSIDVIGNDNVIEAQTSKLEQSFCRSYFSTFWRKQRIVSPLVFNHPTLSFFSRGINVAFSLIQGSFLIVIGLLGMTSEFVSVLTIIAGLILSRILWVLLEVVLHKKRHKYINYIQIVLIIVLISLEGVIIFIPTQIKEDGGALVNVSIIIFLIFELIIYELVIHIFQVILARRLVKDPSKLNKMSKLSKLFLNPMVYEHINQSG